MQVSTERVSGRKRGQSEKAMKNWNYEISMVKKGRGRKKLENDEQGLMRERDKAALEESA